MKQIFIQKAMNQIQMNQYYLIFWILIFIRNIKFITTQDENNNNNTTSLSDSLTTELSFITSKPSLENSPATSNKPANDFIDDIFYSPKPQYPPTYNPTAPASPPLSFHYPTLQATGSDKLFEFSFKKKFFPFGGLSLDIKKYKNDPILYQYQQYIKPIIESPYLMVPYSDSPLHFVTTTKKPHTNYFGNIFKKSFDWGAIVNVPGIAIQKFGKLGINIFSGQSSGQNLVNHISNGLITGQVSPYGYIDERRLSKVA